MIKKYDRLKAKEYAKKWAFSRNPKYYAFDNIGGDCTNFVSQCIFAGGGIMKYTPEIGWYYINSNQRSPSWTGVKYLYNFLINNSGVGPFAKEISPIQSEIGDIIQLGNLNRFYHSLIIVEKDNSEIYVAAHNFNAYLRNLNTYTYEKIRFLHIEGFRY